jgi:GNAT superfamily N-acetyltransferase
MSTIFLVAASARDLEPIALLHAQSWRNTYRGIVPDEFLDQVADSDRRKFWAARFASTAADRRLLLQALSAGSLLGFVSVILDAEPRWGARLDSLHVRADAKGSGIGRTLFEAAREWIARASPGTAMHLWCVERNHIARRFYERQGGAIVETANRPFAGQASVLEVRYWWAPLPP